jgi:hypothetical protein
MQAQNGVTVIAIETTQYIRQVPLAYYQLFKSLALEVFPYISTGLNEYK